MLISHEHQFIFIHVPKTGGSSIHAALTPFAHRPEQVWANRTLSGMGINVNWLGPLHWRRGRGHMTARELPWMLPGRVVDHYLKMAFVRNPWDWMVSYYHFLKNRKTHRLYNTVRQLDFESYLRFEIQRGNRSQSKLLTDRRGKLLVDWVGRFEQLTDDFETICTTLGIQATIEHRNRTQHARYTDCYNEVTQKLVADHWAEDIERFDYNFEGDGSQSLFAEAA